MPITITERAATELKDVIQAQNNPKTAVRVWTVPGGCSGMSYQMALDENDPEKGDEIYEQFGVKVYVDPDSLPFLDGATVDYVEDQFGGGFKIDNPNAVSSCGCGSSYQTADSQAGGGGCGGCGCKS